MKNFSKLKLLEEVLREKYTLTRNEKFNYSIPAIWLCRVPKNPSKKVVKVHPYRFFLNAVKCINQIKPLRAHSSKNGEWTKRAVVYNLFVRVGTAFNHSRNGKLDLPVNEEGFRETGSFMKAIALLPYIKSLGVNTIHLLPITSIGSDGNKGTLGSPYAIKNPYELDPNLSEPNLGVGADIEFSAFVEAAHKLNIKIVVEFVFRTSAKDADWIKEHPEWYYWIREDIEDRHIGSNDESKYGPPIFTRQELEKIFLSVSENNFDTLIPPHKVYREMFTKPPAKETIHKEGSRLIGVLDDGTRVRIPGAFADWPPNDVQPPWGDVTYLKLYDHPDFNYIAYNTVRMYDSSLARSENINKSLWEKIIGIIPHYQRTFGIDGVMIDMGHALPMELKQKMIKAARDINPDFAFWDENFSVSEKSLQEGYNAVIGFAWSVEHDTSKFKKMLYTFSDEGYPIPFFATAESHNTPRAAARYNSVGFSKYTWVINNFIPAIPFIHNGFEIGETFPINTGLDFKPEELYLYPSNTLPLFSEYAFNWECKNEFINFIRKVSLLRKKYEKLILNSSPKSFIFHHIPDENIIVFERKNRNRVVVIANGSNKKQKLKIDLSTKKQTVKDLLQDKTYDLEKGNLSVYLKPFQCLVISI